MNFGKFVIDENPEVRLNYKNKRAARGVLRKAKLLIVDKRHWIQGVEEQDGAYCAAGAVNAAEGTHVAKYLANCALDFTTACRNIVEFNDADARRHSDVLKKFDRAIEVLK